MTKTTLRAARINRGFTQKEVATALGVSVKTIHRWEKGITYPNTKYIEPLCCMYDVSYDDIYFCPAIRLKRI